MSRDYRFGPYRFDPATLELWCEGARVPLEPKPAQILERLLERAGDMVRRQELLELCWPKLPQVADPSLNTCVRQIRAALGDDAADPRFVETLRGRGYRFVAEVARGAHGAPPAQARTGVPAPRVRLRWLVPAAAVAAVAALVLVAGRPGAPSTPDAAGASTEAALPAAVDQELHKARLVLDRLQDPAKALDIVDALFPEGGSFARVHTMRSEMLLLLGRHAEAREAVARGLALTPDDAVGLRVEGSLAMFEARWGDAEQALARSVAREPNEAGTWIARAYLSTVLGRFGDAEGAIAEALALDPLSPTVHNDVGILHLWAGRYPEAAASCREVVDLLDEPPGWAVECVFDALRLAGRDDEAVLWAGPLFVEAGLVPAEALEGVAAVEHLSRARLAALRTARDIGRPVSAYVLAVASARAGDATAALEALEIASTRPGFGVLSAAVDPRFAALRGDPRFEALVARLGLESVS